MDGAPKSHASDMRVKPLKTIPVVPRRSSLPLQPLALHQTKSHSFLSQADVWTLIFRGRKGIQESVYDTWLDSGRRDDYPLADDFPRACLHMTNSGSCDRHFRSRIVKNMISMAKVKATRYVDLDQLD
ncbi:hypothetical protein RRG08_020642 [Elysia crispata]|uniref:Uncharacterized protein n=1 Tax=Elysia crispata TaxID=231223 RepID=A0AAE0YJA8_9GAST|nr:hypothetical protein RRG08_020642 [Elysia crispata]